MMGNYNKLAFPHSPFPFPFNLNLSLTLFWHLFCFSQNCVSAVSCCFASFHRRVICCRRSATTERQAEQLSDESSWVDFKTNPSKTYRLQCLEQSLWNAAFRLGIFHWSKHRVFNTWNTLTKSTSPLRSLHCICLSATLGPCWIHQSTQESQHSNNLWYWNSGHHQERSNAQEHLLKTDFQIEQLLSNVFCFLQL